MRLVVSPCPHLKGRNTDDMTEHSQTQGLLRPCCVLTGQSLGSSSSHIHEGVTILLPPGDGERHSLDPHEEVGTGTKDCLEMSGEVPRALQSASLR